MAAKMVDIGAHAFGKPQALLRPYERPDDEWMKCLSSAVANLDIYGWYV
jgi:hypothetical protein